MLLLEGLHLHIASVRALLGHAGKARWAEAGLLAVHIGGYLTAAFAVLSPLQAVVFLVVQQGLFGVYMGSSFAPNHKGMPVVGKDEKVDFLRRQVLTSRNIRGSLLTDLALGGLNHQIEHHLFPSMPRPSLRHAPSARAGVLRPARHSLLAGGPAGLLCAGTAAPPRGWPDARPGTGCGHSRRRSGCQP